MKKEKKSVVRTVGRWPVVTEKIGRGGGSEFENYSVEIGGGRHARGSKSAHESFATNQKICEKRKSKSVN